MTRPCSVSASPVSFSLLAAAAATVFLLTVVATTVGAVEKVVVGNGDGSTPYEIALAHKSYGKVHTIETSNEHRFADTSDPEMGHYAANFHLEYMAVRGLADLPALILETVDEPYTGTYYGRDDFNNGKKATTPLGRVPVLTHGEFRLHQSSSIVRYLAKYFSLSGITPEDEAEIDVLYETVKELFGGHKFLKVHPEALEAAVLAGQALPEIRYATMTNRGQYSELEQSTAILRVFEEVLATSQTGHLVGTDLSYADLALFLKLDELAESDKSPHWVTAPEFTRLAAFYNNIAETDGVERFLAHGRRMPRIERCGGEGAAGDYCYKHDRHCCVAPPNSPLGDGEEDPIPHVPEDEYHPGGGEEL